MENLGKNPSPGKPTTDPQDVLRRIRKTWTLLPTLTKRIEKPVYGFIEIFVQLALSLDLIN